MTVDNNYEQAIAIIGLSGRFPGARNLDEFWCNLKNGVESISSFSDAELLAAGTEQEIIEHPSAIKRRGVVQDIDLFDASFFAISPEEAEVIDPQQRLFLEHCWEALEQAGYCLEDYGGSTGVYAGLSSNTYLLRNLVGNEDRVGSIYSDTVVIGNRGDFAASRVAYKLHLKGPAISVQCACSSSLVALHLACQSLWQGECDLALAGGVSLILPQVIGVIYNEKGILSPEGRCRTFDKQSQGTVGGNGVGVVVLKLLSEAMRDGDTIHALIRGSAVNNDSSSKIGYTAPGVEGQARVVAEAQAVAGVDPGTITYIEAHGTGTTLGDPIEVAALTKAFRRHTAARNFCAIGSVKPNIGHLDVASGIAGLIKTVLALKHKQLPGLLHFEAPNPEIDFVQSPFYVNKELIDWRSPAGPRRAGVSSFGTGGTNAHVILEEAPPPAPPRSSRPYQLLMLSSKTASALEQATENLAAYLERSPALNLADVAYTLQVGRQAFPHRRVLLCRNESPVGTQATRLRSNDALSGLVKHTRQAITFLCAPGEAPCSNVGLELYQQEPLFRSMVDQCSELLRPPLGFDVRAVLYPSHGREDRPEEQPAHLALPELFVLEYALACLWMSWGIRPQSVIGCGGGEYVAACLAGIFSLEECLSLVANATPQRLHPAPPTIPIYSCRAGAWLTPEMAGDPAYWRQPPEYATPFIQALQTIPIEGEASILEIGSGQAWDTPGNEGAFRALPFSMARLAPAPDMQSLLLALGQFWLRGVPVDWSGFYACESRLRVPLPTYPFERQRYWVAPLARGR